MARFWRFGSERGRASKPVRRGAGTGVPCPYNGKMRPSAWARLPAAGRLKRRPYIYSKSEEAGEARRGHGCAVPLQRKDAAFGLLRSGMVEKAMACRDRCWGNYSAD